MYAKPMRLNDHLGPSYYGYAYEKDKADLFGIELELEGRGIRTDAAKIRTLWDIHNDGSLRRRDAADDALEYVLRKPLPKTETLTAIQLLFQFLTKPDVRVYDSYRTSTHVHVNFLNDTMITLYNFITLAILTDELLVSLNGEHRVGNNFCLRFIDAPAVIDQMVKSIKVHGTINDVGRDNRYGSVNLCSLFKFGSIEFRSLECTTDFERLDHWVSTLQALKDAARTYDNPMSIIQEYSMMGDDQFLYKVLGGRALKYLRVGDYKGMMRRGMRLAQDFAYCAEWKQVDEGQYKPKKGTKSFDDAIAQRAAIADAQAGLQLNGLRAAPPPPGFADALAAERAIIRRREEERERNRGIQQQAEAIARGARGAARAPAPRAGRVNDQGVPIAEARPARQVPEWLIQEERWGAQPVAINLDPIDPGLLRDDDENDNRDFN